MENHDRTLFEHVVQTLPSDINRRRSLLNALANRLKEGPQLAQVLDLLSGIDQHLNGLRELQLEGRPS